MRRVQVRGIELFFDLFLHTFLLCRLGIYTCHGDGGERRRAGGGGDGRGGMEDRLE